MNLNSYQSISYFAEGGMAIIYTAYHKQPRAAGMGEKLAIKVIRPEYSQRRLFMNAFEREGELLLQLFHQNIVRVYEQVIEGNTCALVMEFMDSPDLAQFLTFKPQGCIPWEDEQNPTLVGCNTKKIAEQVLSALHYAHTREHPIFHLDIKPANIKLDPQKNRIKILDFGIAAIKDSDDLIKASAGTIEYIPPEQIEAADSDIGVDARTDLYAVGFLLYELLTGKLPWGKESSSSIQERKNTQDFPSPRESNPNVPEHVSNAIMMVLRPDPNDRPRDAMAFLQLLQNSVFSSSIDQESIQESSYETKEDTMSFFQKSSPYAPAVFFLLLVFVLFVAYS